MDPVATDRRPGWKRWALLAAALLVLALAAAAWHAWRMRQIGAHDAQLARLQGARAREAALVDALAAAPADPTACPPGQVLQRTASPTGAVGGGARPASPGPAPAASAASGSPPAASAPARVVSGFLPSLDVEVRLDARPIGSEGRG
jgi:hypothetical protein